MYNVSAALLKSIGWSSNERLKLKHGNSIIYYNL